MQRYFSRTLTLTLSLALALIMLSSVSLAQYKLTNLVSNQSGKAKHQDALLVNAWGLVYVPGSLGSPGSPFWVSDEGSGWSTLYDGSGNPQQLQVVVPKANGSGFGSPTGIVYNGSKEFAISNWVSLFLFATLDGSIQGWSDFNPGSTLVAVDNQSKNASYNGLAITRHKSGNLLYATDINNNKVDVYDGKFKFVKSFTDPMVPKGFVPFGIQDINGQVYVSFAAVASGAASGYIDIFKENGTLVKRFTHGKPLNQPWGFAVAPKNFGLLSNTLLISNNTNTGTINGFNLKTGKFVGTIKNTKGKPIVIDQLWGIEFGGGSSANGQKNQLFFTAGPGVTNMNGLFGVIAP
jgi:uncharacterized protein (TIGR03118 family)